ncbi:MAG: Gfo/Idh/MocA family protein [Halobacteriaceae archaeon]
MTDPLRVAGIGVGGLAGLELRLLDDLDGVSVLAGADIDPGAREQFAAASDGAAVYEEYEAMLSAHGDALDAVNVATPHTLHHEHAAACLDRGLHVHLEKPMTTTTADAVDLCRRADARDLVLQVGYQRHVHPAYRALRSAVTRGRIGQVHMATCHLAQDWISGQAGRWRTDPALSGGGQLIDSGSHLLDALLWTTDADPRRVAAVADRQGHAVDVNTALAVTLDGPDGEITASVGVSGDGTGFDEGLILWGTDGHLTYGGDGLSVTSPGGETEPIAVEDDPDFQALTRRKLAAFVEAIRGDREVVVAGEFGVQVTALTEAAFAAIDEGETIDVRALRDEAAAAVDERRRED